MGRIQIKWVVLIGFLAIGVGLMAQSVNDLEKTYPIIPRPQEMVFNGGTIGFEAISWSPALDPRLHSGLVRFFEKNGFPVQSDGISIQLLTSNKQPAGGYEIRIKDTIEIEANGSLGFWYGLQSLFQLFRFTPNGKGFLPKVQIRDAPAFGIRGFMHDTGRNYQSLEQLKAQIEILSFYKFNAFHWHLTDNPAWRLESKIYPYITDSAHFTRQKGAYYSQKDFIEIVNFCKDRFITVIPEFDIPGHTDAFRRAFDLDKMDQPQTGEILKNLFGELLSLVDANTMPYIHIGTDEVRNDREWMPEEVLQGIVKLIHAEGRKAIVWRKGMDLSIDSTQLIHQLWASFPPDESVPFIDSRSNYINHLDPLAGVPRLFFQQPCRQPRGDNKALGGILCVWPDNKVGRETDILKQNPIYPSIVFYADAIWKGRDRDYPEYWAQLPFVGTSEWREFADFEDAVIVHRDLFFEGKFFPYIRQKNLVWSLIGPFDHKGVTTAVFPPEREVLPMYEIGDTVFRWSDGHVGGTIHLNHFFGFPSYTTQKAGTIYATTKVYAEEAKIQSFWIGFQGWSRSGRRGGPTAKLGAWYRTQPKIWVNQNVIPPPIWQQPNLGAETSEIPFVDEDYYYRAPTKVVLKKGWNTILVKVPKDESTWKWMFTCIPVETNSKTVKEAEDVVFNPDYSIEKK